MEKALKSYYVRPPAPGAVYLFTPAAWEYGLKCAFALLGFPFGHVVVPPMKKQDSRGLPDVLGLQLPTLQRAKRDDGSCSPKVSGGPLSPQPVGLN